MTEKKLDGRFCETCGDGLYEGDGSACDNCEDGDKPWTFNSDTNDPYRGYESEPGYGLRFDLDGVEV